MTTTKHTPGPLHCNMLFTPGQSPQYGIWPESDPDERDIAIVKGENAEADGRLFAAAPDLLEALVACEALIDESLTAEYLHEDSQPGVTELLRRVRAAIASATS